jgi:hypothetical protein
MLFHNNISEIVYCFIMTLRLTRLSCLSGKPRQAAQFISLWLKQESHAKYYPLSFYFGGQAAIIKYYYLSY